MQTAHQFLLGDLLYLGLNITAGAKEDRRGEQKRHAS
jgi:hypothetical protein